jgi:predicted TIM-barrel fold metal-dependent hydrolase
MVNPCGSPIDRDRDGMAQWREGLKLLGSAPNVHIKISAMSAYDPSPTPESLREVALHCIECFGVDRSMIGTDFPVGRLCPSAAPSSARMFAVKQEDAVERRPPRRSRRHPRGQSQALLCRPFPRCAEIADMSRRPS